MQMNILAESRIQVGWRHMIDFDCKIQPKKLQINILDVINEIIYVQKEKKRITLRNCR